MDFFEQLGEQSNDQSGTTSASLAPLPQSLSTPQRGYPDTASMMEFIGEASPNNQTNSWNAFPYAPNENLNRTQINGMVVEPRMMGNPNSVGSSNNYNNGTNRQFPQSQPNLVGALLGNTNQRSDISFRDSIINSQPTWNSRLPQTQTLSPMLPQNQSPTLSTLMPHTQTRAFSTLLPRIEASSTHQTQTQAFSTLLPRSDAFSRMLPQTQTEAFTSLLPQTQTFPMNPNTRLESHLQRSSAPMLTNPINVHHHGSGTMLPAPASPSANPNSIYSNFGVQASVFGRGSNSFSSVVSPIPSLRDDQTVNSYQQQATITFGHVERDVSSLQELLRSQSMPEQTNNNGQNSESQNATLRGSFSLPSSSQAQGSESSKKDRVARLLRLVTETEQSQEEVAEQGNQGRSQSPVVSSSRKASARSNSADDRASKMRRVLSEPAGNTSRITIEKEVQRKLPTVAPTTSNGVYLPNGDGDHPDPFFRAMIAQGMISPNPPEEKEEEEEKKKEKASKTNK